MSNTKSIVVTGGAGEIGSAICRKFAVHGYDVIVTYRSNAERANRLLSSLSHGNHVAFKVPNTDVIKINKLKHFIQEQYGKVDILVNNAGITTPVHHHDLDSLNDEWIDKIMQTNFRGAFAMVRALKELLLLSKEETSLVVNISSIAAVNGIGSNVAYCASKAALDSMTRSLARALAPKIRVLSIAPGFVEGEYTENFEPSFVQMQKDKTPLGRLVKGEDVADGVFAAATLLTHSTGSVITVDGGRLLL
ncbi:MAG: SDR family oxidoreductase [Saprospiraceae bacterium]